VVKNVKQLLPDRLLKSHTRVSHYHVWYNIRPDTVLLSYVVKRFWILSDTVMCIFFPMVQQSLVGQGLLIIEAK